ncbi:GntR family transcriptional regulator [Streptomyces sp. TRM43335]|uniref:GntR family transcriptional regulator n=1 Tax=Streptomyces taklimakanensis TaxID=2569853 RepID=A0A6G2BDS1_9ACTN|nr:GntR family transcriptional regulator [Streptomyces taklimakanensis]MTE20052.1 GntR family transcriptional regulator [Streptomyces taklimakanensis]
MGEIQRPGALYKQVAAAIRDAIASGEFAPGAPLPSEAQLIARYQVSRPTVRNAIAALRSEGLIDVIHGKGSFVRGAPTPVLTIDRTVTRDTAGHFTTGHDAWKTAEEPSVYRTKTTATTGPLLALDEGEALFGVDRLLTDPATGTRALHRTLIPFATAEGTALAEHPDTEPARIYALLTEAGHTLSWTETTRARMPLPDERTTLQLPDATPVIHTTRTTLGRDDRPLILEELTTSGDRAQLAYRITADSPHQAQPTG